MYLALSQIRIYSYNRENLWRKFNPIITRARNVKQKKLLHLQNKNVFLFKQGFYRAHIAVSKGIFQYLKED
jgi:hypothetical protein